MPKLHLVFLQLRSILEPYAARLDRKTDSTTELYVDTRYLMPNKKTLFFGAVQTKKSYVSFHLMPVYVQPDLLDSLSPALRKRMQGKSCFNFKEIDTPLLKELAALTKSGYASYKAKGFV